MIALTLVGWGYAEHWRLLVRPLTVAMGVFATGMFVLGVGGVVHYSAGMVGLAALAGLPAVAGIWLGSYAFSPHWAALAIGAGAIVEVVVEVGGLMVRRARRQGTSWASAPALAGVFLGVAVMYGTALLVQA
jgi:hypothetical protein